MQNQVIQKFGKIKHKLIEAL